ALGANARLFGAESSTAARPSSYGRDAIVATVLDQIDTDDIAEGSTKLLMTVAERAAVSTITIDVRQFEAETGGAADAHDAIQEAIDHVIGLTSQSTGIITLSGGG